MIGMTKTWVLLSCVLLLAASEGAPSGVIDPIARLGAVGALGTALLVLLYRTLPSMSKDFRQSLSEIAGRHENWERVHHEDSKRLNDTLRKISENHKSN